jgi:signal transduction histidine kinase/CheY-like chemotaxis protein
VSRNVLLIDDEPNFRRAIMTRMRNDGFTFFESEHPAQAVRILEAKPQIRVILLDLSFPDAEESARLVLDFVQRRPDDYRVIVLTAHEDLLEADEAIAKRVFHYLPKGRSNKGQGTAAIRFSLNQAFTHLEWAVLARKIGYMQEVQQLINEERDLGEILDLICRSVQAIVGAYTCHLRVYDFKHGDFHLMGFAPDGPLRNALGLARSKGQLFSGRVVESGVPELHDDFQHDENFLTFKRETLAKREMAPGEEEYWATVSSAYIVPISTGIFGPAEKPAVDAVLNVSSQSVGFFDDEKRALVDEFMSQATLAIAKDWLRVKRKELHQDYGEITKMLSDIRKRLAGRHVLHDIYGTVTEKLSALVSAEVVSIFVFNPRTKLIENVAEYRGNEHVHAPDEKYKVGQSFVGKIFDTRKSELLQTWPTGTKLEKDPRFDHTNTEHYIDIIPSRTLHHYLGVPIQVGGKIIGVLRVMNKKSDYYVEAMNDGAADNNGTSPRTGRFCLLERGFTPDCQNVVEITASHLAIAIQNALLFKAKLRRLRQLKTLGEVGRIINSDLDIETVLEQTIHAMAVVMQAEICMLFLREGGEERLVLRQCFGIPEERIAGASYAFGERLTGTAAATGSASLIAQAGVNDGKYDDKIRGYLSEKADRPREIESLMVVPLIAKGIVQGVMKVINKGGGDPHYRPEDLRFFETFGQYVSVALANASDYAVTSQELEVAKRDAFMSDLVWAVTHEITNTSGAIPTNVDLIREELGPVSPDVDEMLRLIAGMANQATEFAREIMLFSKARRGAKRALDVNEVARSTLRELRELGRNSYTARLETSLSAAPLVCTMYENPFKQIVRNIVINAFQELQGRDDGLITVSSREGDGPTAGWAVMTFIDNGRGILPEHLPRIFDADFTTRESGNGIGLWLVKNQLDFMGGTIEAANEPGAGARFTVSLPLTPLNAEPAV